MTHSSQKFYLALSLLMSMPLIAMDGGTAVLSHEHSKAPSQAPLSFDELMRIQKEFFLKKRAEFAQGNKRSYGPADIDADEIEMMKLEAPELTRLLEQRFVFIQDGSEFEGWIIRAMDRKNRYESSLKKHAAIPVASSDEETNEPAAQPLSLDELITIEKEFFLKKRAEFAQGTKKSYGPADIDADEIDIMKLEAPQLKILKARGLVCFQKGSDYQGWLIRAFDRKNRYKSWLKKQAELKALEEAKNTDSN